MESDTEVNEAPAHLGCVVEDSSNSLERRCILYKAKKERSLPKIAPTVSKDQHSLLNIIPEVRSQIYREVLVSMTRIEINRDNHKQPTLLCVCTQIRAEASSIYYVENSFGLKVWMFQSGAVYAWYRHARHYGRYLNLCYVVPKTVYNHELGEWSDLLEWLHRGHQRQVPICTVPCWRRSGMSSQKVELELIHRLFRTVRLLRDVPWQTVREVLANSKLAFIDMGSWDFARPEEEWTDEKSFYDGNSF